MNEPAGSFDPAAWNRRRRPAVSRLAALLALIAAATLLTGCLGFLKPARSVARYFVLTPLPSPAEKPANRNAPVLGVGRVKLPSYLSGTSLAVRRGTNEIDYLPSVLWAERLENGLQRVVVANLATLVPTDQIRLSAWSSQEVNAELYITVEQFDLDSTGRGRLVAWWRILSPGGERTLKAGESRFSREGPAPESDPSGAIATLSDLLADFSRQLAETMQEAVK